MSTPEKVIQTKICLALSQAGCVIWRVNTGQGWLGNVIHQAQGQVTLKDAHKMPFGLCKGGSDLIGIGPDGAFIAVEVKTKTGRASKEQLAFIEGVKRAGGRAGIARSEQEALDIALGN